MPRVAASSADGGLIDARGAAARAAFGAVLDDCLAQIGHHAAGLGVADATQRAVHVHQLRVGIRRLRSALRSFRGWVPMPPDALVAGLRSLFSTLGLARDSAVLASGVVAELRLAGGPALAPPPAAPGPDLAAIATAPRTRQALRAWASWRAALHTTPDGGAPGPALRRRARKRLQTWHARIAADWAAFDSLDEAALHALRKRIKRQRYATEFFAPWLKRRQVARYLRALSTLQDRMGRLNDLFVARARYQALLATDATAWFALGWLAARIAEARARARPALRRLCRVDPPGAARHRVSAA